MKHIFPKPRSKFRTVLIVVAPSAIFFSGIWIVCIAAFVLSENPFFPNLIIMIGGTAVVVTVALVALVSVDRPKGTGRNSGQPPSLAP